MAGINGKVFLAFEDELITDKFKGFVNYATNKVGGKPDCYADQQFNNPRCKICGLILPLIVQLYAPLEKSSYHRTLYIFGCVNPNCWNQSASWSCLRCQSICKKSQITDKASDFVESTFNWCEDANNWEDGANVSNHLNSNIDFISNELELTQEISMLNVMEQDTTGKPTCSSFSLQASAEIEEEEGNAVTIDMPNVADTNVANLLENVKPVPQEPLGNLEFHSFFMNVCEEDRSQMYNFHYPEVSSSLMVCDTESLVTESFALDMNNSESKEKYEKTLPHHGDKLFHQLVSRIEMNPGQLLRYIREGGSPLFLYHLDKMPEHCQYCNGALVFEVQLLPTVISRLQLIGSGTGHLEFGTVFVLACQRSCWQDNDEPHTEHVIVQREV